MTWLHRVLGPQIAISRQERTIELLLWKIDHMKLDHIKEIRALVEQFFLVQTNGEDARDQLLAGLRDLDDEIARREEYIL